MKVLHVHSGNLYGGVETFLLTLARLRGLASSMEMSAALCFEGQIARELREAGIPLSLTGDVRLRRPDSIWRARQALAALLAQERHDVVVCHQAWPHAIFGPVAKESGTPLVLWVHMAQRGHWLERLAWRVEPDLVVCNSRFTASTLPATGAPVEVIYPPLAPAMAPSRHDEAVPGGPQNGHVILQVSRMEPLKGQRVCLEALARLSARSDWTCWQVGGAQSRREARYLQSLEDQATRLGIAGRVRFLGQRSDVPRLMESAAILCQPNIAPEAFGLTFVEALFAGIPVVTSALGAAREIIDPACGVLAEPGDPMQLASQLERLLDDSAERLRLGRNGRARVLAICDPASQMTRIAHVLERAAAASTVHR